MIMSIRHALDKAFGRTNKENGDSVVTTLFMIPFAIFLIFALVNLSMYFQARSSIQNVARDGARVVALYGGNSANVPRNDTGKDVSSLVYNKLWTNGTCIYSHCAKPPTVSCAPGTATKAGQDVWCEIKYYYSPIAADPFGFSAATTQTLTIREVYVSETGY